LLPRQLRLLHSMQPTRRSQHAVMVVRETLIIRTLWACQVFKQVVDFLFLKTRWSLSAEAEGTYFRKG
jgi:hypothetical protein